MAKRYGRNQRRKHREQIEEMEKRVALVNDQNLSLCHKYDRVIEQAFDMFINDLERIDTIIDRMTTELTREFGKELMPVVQKIIEVDRRPRKPIHYSVSVPRNQSVEVLHIRGVIPELNYNYALMRY